MFIHLYDFKLKKGHLFRSRAPLQSSRVVPDKSPSSLALACYYRLPQHPAVLPQWQGRSITVKDKARENIPYQVLTSPANGIGSKKASFIEINTLAGV